MDNGYRAAGGRGQLPKYASLVACGVAVCLSLVINFSTGFNILAAGIIAAVLFVFILVAWSGALEGRRKAKDRFMACLLYGAFLVAFLPLLSMIVTMLINGLPGLNAHFLQHSMNGVVGIHDQRSVEEGAPVLGGAYHAIIGTLSITGWACVIAVPVGLLAAVYLVEYGEGRILARWVALFVDVMTGIPSIVAGLFAAASCAFIFGPGVKTGFAAAISLAVLMIPVVVRTTEEVLRIVPNELREASYALGARKWRTIVKIVIPTAISGIASGVVVAVARVVGETAPLLVTAGFSERINGDVFSGWMSTLPTYIYYQYMTPTTPVYPEPSHQRAWAAVLVLVVIVMLLNVVARVVAKVFAPKTTKR